MPKFKVKNTKSLTEISQRHFYRLAKKDAESKFHRSKNQPTKSDESGFLRDHESCATALKVATSNSDIHNFNFAEINESDTESDISSSVNVVHSDNSRDGISCSPNHSPTHQPVNITLPQNSNSIKQELKSWSIKHGIEHSALDDLLKILRQHPIGNDLPKDSRTLKQTPRSTNIKNIGNGDYCHFGLTNGIRQTLNMDLQLFNQKQVLNLKLGIDGFSISDSNTSQLWPILGNIPPSNHVFVIGIFHGYSKPRDSNEYLEDFVLEINHLIDHGISQNGKTWSIKLSCIICDAPAKSFITKTKGHTGFHSCTKCIQEGEFKNGRTFFPDLESTLRTDESFLSLQDKDYHLGASILATIKNFKPVTEIPIDYMHLICIGVVKKVIRLWSDKRSYKVKLSSKEIRTISEDLSTLSPFITCEFSRKPRDLGMISQWKATELRQFILYTVPIALQSFLKGRKSMYNHMMSLHVAMRILTNSHLLSDHADYAHSLLKHFVEVFQILYGIEYTSHNVHGLLHIVNDAKLFGTLDLFSAFPFENFMRLLGRKLKKSEKPLQQIHRRYMEGEQALLFQCEQKKPHEKNYFGQQHCDGPVLNGSFSTQYKTYITSQFELKCKTPNNCAILKNETIILVENFVFQDDIKEVVMIGKACKIQGPLYNNPCDSTLLSCYIVKEDVQKPLQKWPISILKNKCLKLPLKNGNWAVLPIQHTC